MRHGQDFTLLFQELAQCGALYSNGSIPAVSIPVLHTAKIAQKRNVAHTVDCPLNTHSDLCSDIGIPSPK